MRLILVLALMAIAAMMPIAVSMATTMKNAVREIFPTPAYRAAMEALDTATHEVVAFSRTCPVSDVQAAVEMLVLPLKAEDLAKAAWQTPARMTPNQRSALAAAEVRLGTQRDITRWLCSSQRRALVEALNARP